MPVTLLSQTGQDSRNTSSGLSDKTQHHFPKEADGTLLAPPPGPKLDSGRRSGSDGNPLVISCAPPPFFFFFLFSFPFFFFFFFLPPVWSGSGEVIGRQLLLQALLIRDDGSPLACLTQGR